VVEEPAEPGGTSRASFGFTSSPISPIRHSASPTSPAPVGYDSPDLSQAPAPATPAIAIELPIRRMDDTAERRLGIADRRPESADRRMDDTGEHRFDGSDRRADSLERRFGGSDRRADAGEPRFDERRSVSADRPFGERPTGPRPFGERQSGEIPFDGPRFDTAERRAVRPEPAGAPAAAPVPSPAGPVPPPAPRQSRGVTVGIVLLSLVVLVAGSIIGVVYFTGSDDKLESVLQLGAGDNGKRTASAPLDNRTKASFELLAASNKVNLSIGELGDDLYRISTPDDAGILPSPVIRNDDVKLQVTRDGDGTGGEIDVVLAAKVNWQLRFSGYAEEQVLDLSGGQISGIEMVGGLRSAEVTLPRPSGTVPIKVNGAVEKLVLRSPADSPVRVKVGGGAQTVVAGTRTLKNVGAGSTLTPKDWAVQNRYDVGAGAPITTLTLGNA
jgi:hypothetical protein